MKSKSIQSELPKLTLVMTGLMLVFIIPANIFLQLNQMHRAQCESAEEFLWQIEELISKNETELKNTTELYKSRCIRAAKMAAYYTASNPQCLTDASLARKLAEVINIDEVHYFDTSGKIFAGSNPEYYGYSLDSGDQMAFFKPMLEDRELQLCQDVLPNTAEDKEMQYAAVWMDDGSAIVQIGMAPTRLLEIIKSNDLQNIIDEMPFDMNGYIHVVDKKHKEIIASTAPTMVGLDLSNVTFDASYTQTHDTYQGKRYCVYTRTYGDYLLIRTYESSVVLTQVFQSTIMAGLYLILLSLGIGVVIQWYVKHKIVGALYEMIDVLRETESGDLDQITLQTEITEYNELLWYINRMLRNIRSNWNKLSYIMDSRSIPLGIYEINHYYHKVFMNQKVVDLFHLSNTQDQVQEETLTCIHQALNQPVDATDHIYQHNQRYLKIDCIESEESVTYYLLDVTLWWEGYNQLKEYSEIDPLTNLYNRRGFYKEVDALYTQPDQLKWHAVVMVDADGLKKINDISGHDIGDQYLQAMAQVISNNVGSRAVCARLGGDEFVCFMYGETSLTALEERLNGLRQARGQALDEQTDNRIEFSMGVAYAHEPTSDYHHLMKEADEAMYLEKYHRKSK